MFFNTFFFFQIFHRVLQHKNRAITHFFTLFWFVKPMLSPPKTHGFTSWNAAYHKVKPMVSRNATNEFSFFDTTIKNFIFITFSHTSYYKQSTSNARSFACLRPRNFYFQTWPFYGITILTIKEDLSRHLLNNIKIQRNYLFSFAKKQSSKQKEQLYNNTNNVVCNENISKNCFCCS